LLKRRKEAVDMTTDASTALAVPFSIIPPKDTDPLWPGWFLRRHVTLLVAPGGTGKGLLTIDMAARVTRGKGFPSEPEGTVHEPEAVILVAPEDDPNEAVAWRLQAAGADLSLVFNLTVLPNGEHFSLPTSVDNGTLAKAVEQIQEATGKTVGLVVIDPLFAVATVNLATNKGARQVIDPLELFAHETRTSVVLTHHTVKSGATAGSKGLIDACRVVLRIGRDDKDSKSSNARILSVEKANALSDNESGQRYLIVGNGDETCVIWPVEAELLAERMRTRGYAIDPDMAAPKPVSETPVPAPQLFGLFEADGKDSAAMLGKFDSTAKAREFAEKQTGCKLEWKAGPIEGSEGADGTPKGQSETFRYFSILPLDADAKAV
jgi:KaiC/GvpD/RAD55 family RecA-like ATPase